MFKSMNFNRFSGSMVVRVVLLEKLLRVDRKTDISEFISVLLFFLLENYIIVFVFFFIVLL